MRVKRIMAVYINSPSFEIKITVLCLVGHTIYSHIHFEHNNSMLKIAMIKINHQIGFFTDLNCFLGLPMVTTFTISGVYFNKVERAFPLNLRGNKCSAKNLGEKFQ